MSDEFRKVDLAFADLMKRYAPMMSDGCREMIALLCYAVSMQHSCIDLSHHSPAEVSELESLPIVGDGSEPTPLVLSGERLYLHRYFQYELDIAAWVHLKNRPFASALEDDVRLTNYFDLNQQVNWQAVAALQALLRFLTIITGGPGTGKTSTVFKILALLLEQNSNLVIKLAAPTGKAAMRLSEAITASIPELPEAVRDNIPSDVVTLHRLLGMRNDGRTFRHHHDNPIRADVLIIDESSMIDLVMMHRLISAISPETRVILLGDPNQLPSVEAGNVLQDLCLDAPAYSAGFRQIVHKHLGFDLVSHGRKTRPMTDCLCRFEQSYRFEHEQGIGQLANDVRRGQTVVTSSEDDQVQVFNLADFSDASLVQQLCSYYFEYELLLAEPGIDALTMLYNFEQTRILSPMRDGRWGTEALNHAIESYLEHKGHKPRNKEFYHGRPIIIMRNDYQLGLFNGDVGICLGDSSEGEMEVAFLSPSGDVNRFLATRLPPHETCFVMTVHKSQGSEFDHVTLVLPSPGTQRQEKLISRELIYTAITRPRHSIAIFTNPQTWSDGVSTPAARMSGLADLLARPPVPQLELFSQSVD